MVRLTTPPAQAAARPIAPAGDLTLGKELPMATQPAVPFVEIEALRVKEFIPAAKEALSSIITEQGQSKVIRPVFNWAGRNSLFPLHWGLACCAIEFAAAFGARWDAERFGVVARSSPRQADLMIVNGTVTWKVAHKLITLYEQMSEPKWVIAMGNCATGGGPFRTAYSVVPGVDKLVPVDVYIAGCPPRPEAMLDGILKLEQLIRERKE
ncbi:MAG TPA: NADH-quinone oxidoreductase subunit B family protein [Thermoplasmata archaeon]|nr:NADH-quinone oxidoreductase subunit B family protein [Thermoplasmata archaeon]